MSSSESSDIPDFGDPFSDELRMESPETGLRSGLPQGAAPSDPSALQTAPVATAGVGGANFQAQMEQLLVLCRNQEITNKNLAAQLQLAQARDEFARNSAARRHEEVVSSKTSTTIYHLCKQHQPLGGEGFARPEDFFTKFRQVFAGVMRYWHVVQRGMARHVSAGHNPQRLHRSPAKIGQGAGRLRCRSHAGGT